RLRVVPGVQPSGQRRNNARGVAVQNRRQGERHSRASPTMLAQPAMRSSLAIHLAEQTVRNMEAAYPNLKPWKPGQSGNLNGRPGRVESAFTAGFTRDLARVWAEKGKASMLYTAEREPAVFFATCARLLPNDVRVTVRTVTWPPRLKSLGFCRLVSLSKT